MGMYDCVHLNTLYVLISRNFSFAELNILEGQQAKLNSFNSALLNFSLLNYYLGDLHIMEGRLHLFSDYLTCVLTT